MSARPRTPPLENRAGVLRTRTALLAALTLALGIVFVLSLGFGPADISIIDALAALAGSGPEPTRVIVMELRLPRALLGTMVGATLGLSGAALQGFLRNPLAEPGLIGVSSTAALGAVLTLYTGIAGAFALALPLGGVAGAVIGVTLLQIIAGRGGGALTLILAGIAITSMSGALTALILNLAPSPFAALEIVFWLMGSLADRSFAHVWLALPFMAVGWVMLITLGRPLDALTLGEDTAQSLGFDVGRARTRLVLGTALAVGAATAIAGTIGFLGLVVPHLLRPLVAHRPGALLAPSALGGAVLLLLADIAVRLPFPGNELKLGVLTALVGGPFFLWLIVAYRRSTLA
ncbi:MAG: iron ABC transporter permease [Alphaproteobacteria bacterium]|nr:iron ABC transporter permease [Alphaproteobacteria bacterium]